MTIPEEIIIRRIVFLREEKVMLDVHLAELYGVETRVLKQAVRRNLDRFPGDFMFELTEDEIEQVVSRNVIPSKKHLGGAVPFAFTETGVAMLSSVLKSSKAIAINVVIMRTFVQLRRMVANHSEIMQKLKEMEEAYEGKFQEIFKALNYLLSPDNRRKAIGYKRKGER